MGIQEEKDAYLSGLLAREAISQDEFDDIIFRPSVNTFHSLYLSARFIDNINWGWNSWQAAKAQAVPEGFVLISKDQAKDTERLNFLLSDERYVRTVVQRDIQNEDYEKIGEHFLFTEMYWIDGWDYHENTSSQSKRGALDKAMIEAQEQSHESI